MIWDFVTTLHHVTVNVIVITLIITEVDSQDAES